MATRVPKEPSSVNPEDLYENLLLTLQSPFDTLIDAAFWVTYYLNAQKESKKE